MDPSYAAAPDYQVYDHPHAHWSEDHKQSFTAEDRSRVRDDKSVGLPSDADLSAMNGGRRPSALKIEDGFSTDNRMWHDRSNELHSQMRQYSQSSASTVNTAGQSFARFDPNFAASYAHPPTWPLSQSGVSTPTPAFGQVDTYGHAMPYPAGQASYATYSQDPLSAISMSPQSSQSGWASAHSSDGADQRCAVQSPSFRPVSPQLVLRPDGIRKKNARFEIPKERNLQTIDALILASTDENEKKELKQQKRLLRNRQAALDSRQRKKSHTEKLEQEKKVSEKKMFDLGEVVSGMENNMAIEREAWMQQRHQYEVALRQMQYERDEAIRSKTLETAELRRMNNMLKDLVRDLERQDGRSSGYAPASELNDMSGDYNGYDFDDDWDQEFNLMGGDLKMEEHDPLQRQATPRPNVPAPVPVMEKVTETKPDPGFSWNTFYMCLLFGAFIASTGNNPSNPRAASTGTMSSIPTLPNDYQAEAGNVLKAVLASGPDSARELLSSRSQILVQAQPTTISGAELSRIGAGGSTTNQPTNLERLHSTLTTPSRRQELQAAFSLSTSSYKHVTDPFGDDDLDTEADLLDSPGPTRIEQALANLHAQSNHGDHSNSGHVQPLEKSLMWEKVTDKVWKDFEDLVRRTNAVQHDGGMHQ